MNLAKEILYIIILSLLAWLVAVYAVHSASVLRYDQQLIPVPWWLNAVLWAAVAGAFGGLAGVAGLMDLTDVLLTQANIPKWLRWLAASVMSVIGGSAAAVSFISVLVNQQKIGQHPPTGGEKLFLFSTSVLAGFLGIKLLRMLARNFEVPPNKLDAAIKKSELAPASGWVDPARGRG